MEVRRQIDPPFRGVIADVGPVATAGPAVTQNFTVAAGNTKVIFWQQVTCTNLCIDMAAGTNATAVPVNVRVVSDQDLGVGIFIRGNGTFSCSHTGWPARP